MFKSFKNFSASRGYPVAWTFAAAAAVLGLAGFSAARAEDKAPAAAQTQNNYVEEFGEVLASNVASKPYKDGEAAAEADQNAFLLKVFSKVVPGVAGAYFYYDEDKDLKKTAAQNERYLFRAGYTNGLKKLMPPELELTFSGCSNSYCAIYVDWQGLMPKS